MCSSDLGQKETIAKGREYIASNNFQHLSFFYDDKNDSYSKLKFTGLPVNVFMYPDGYAMLAFGGAIDAEYLEKAIQELLAWQPEAPQTQPTLP